MTNRKQTNGFLLGAIAGGVIGSVTALLLAPKAGKELRQDISARAQKVGQTTAKVAGQVTDTTGRIAKQIGEQAVQITDRTRLAAGSFVNTIRGKNIDEFDAAASLTAVSAAADSEVEEATIEAVEAGETEAAASKEL